MALITWDASYSVGHDGLDDDHQALIKILDDLCTTLSTPGARNDVGATIARMEHYAARHFAREEALLRAAGYPELEPHLAEHKDYLQRLARLRTEHEQGNLFLTVDLMDFLSSWLINHILETDFQYRPWLNPVEFGPAEVGPAEPKES